MLAKIKRDNARKVTQYLLDSFNIKNTSYHLRKTIDNHIDYPSLLTLKDVLQEYGVESAAIRREKYLYTDFQTPFICAIQQQDWDQAVFTVVTDADQEKISYLNPISNQISVLPLDTFHQIDKNVVLLLDSEMAVDEANYTQHLKRQSLGNLSKCFPVLVLLFALGLYAASSFNSEFSWLGLSYFITTCVGLLMAALLIWHDIDAHDPFFNEVCGGQGKKINCNAVLSSKGANFLGISWSIWGAAYFLTLFATQVLYGTDQYFLTMLLLSSLVVSPYILYSFFYQWKVVKQWCPLCLGVQVVLLANVILFAVYYDQYNMFESVRLYPAMLVFTMGISILAMLYYLIPLIKRARDSKDYEKKWRRLRYSPDIFESLLKKSDSMQVSAANMGIVIGNPAATTEIIKVCNPYCGPCSRAHPELEKILSKNKDIKLRIVFTAYGDESDRLTAPAKHLLALQEVYDYDKLKEALDDWYNSPDKDYAAFAEKHPTDQDLSIQNSKLKEMEAWCREMKVRATPTLFINGFELPEGYTVDELKHFY